MGRELEYKYKGTEAAFAALEQRFGPFTQIRMETTYYDTPDAALSKRRWTLRRRMENGVSVCTLKLPLSDGSRGEWEAEAPSIEAGVEALCALGAPGELGQVRNLRPTCRMPDASWPWTEGFCWAAAGSSPFWKWKWSTRKVGKRRFAPLGLLWPGNLGWKKNP